MTITLQTLKQLSPYFLPFFLFFLYKRLISTRPKTSLNLPCSPPKLPIIGNLHQLGSHPHRTLSTLSKKYGDIMFLQFGRKPAIVISSARVASLALRTFDQSFAGRPEYSLAKTMFYGQKDIIYGAYGNHWRLMRSVCVLQLLTNKRVQSFRRVREEEVASMASDIRKLSSASKVVNLSEMLMSLTSQVIFRVAFGSKCSDHQKDGFNFPLMLKNLAELFGSNNIEDVVPWLAWVNWINGVNFKIRKIIGLFDELMEKILVEHTDRLKEAKPDDATIKDFVDILLEAQKESKNKDVTIDNDSIKGVLMDTFAAGTHTCQLTMEWAFTEILRHPTIMDKLQQEVQGIVGEKESVEENEDLEKMVYLKAVIKETLRLHPPLPFLVPRICVKDVKIDGYDVCAGTEVYINAWAIGRNPTFWEDADSFNPDRFLNSPIDFKGQDFEFIPFGSGRRICPGILFATISVELALANIIHQFDWALSVGLEKETLDTAETPGLVLHKRTPLVLVATPRFK